MHVRPAVSSLDVRYIDGLDTPLRCVSSLMFSSPVANRIRCYCIYFLQNRKYRVNNPHAPAARERKLGKRCLSLETPSTVDRRDCFLKFNGRAPFWNPHAGEIPERRTARSSVAGESTFSRPGPELRVQTSFLRSLSFDSACAVLDTGWSHRGLRPVTTVVEFEFGGVGSRFNHALSPIELARYKLLNLVCI